MQVIDLTAKHEELFCLCLEDWSDEAREAGSKRRRWFDRMSPLLRTHDSFRKCERLIGAQRFRIRCQPFLAVTASARMSTSSSWSTRSVLGTQDSVYSE